MALLEAVFAYVQYMMWNWTGTRSWVLVAATMFAYSSKYVLTLSVLIEIAASSGVTMERLKLVVKVKMDLVCAFFLVAQWVWEAIISYKYRFMISPTLLLAVMIP